MLQSQATTVLGNGKFDVEIEAPSFSDANGPGRDAAHGYHGQSSHFLRHLDVVTSFSAGRPAFAIAGIFRYNSLFEAYTTGRSAFGMRAARNPLVTIGSSRSHICYHTI